MSRKSLREQEEIGQYAQTHAGRVFLLKAPAKLNLHLSVTGRRADGYHLLEMLNCTTDLCDEIGLWYESSPALSLVVEPDGVATGPTEANLAIRAFTEFWREFEYDVPPLGVRLHLTKRIPIGAGLGGGSSDAGAILRQLVASFGNVLCTERGISRGEFLQAVSRAALRCGADVPYAVVGGACVVSGIGELLSPVTHTLNWGFQVLIVAPPVHVNTREFYDYYRSCVASETLGAPSSSLLHRVAAGKDLRSLVHNDFEPYVCELQPVVGAVLEVIRHYFPLGAAVTGSGSAMFVLLPRDAGASLPAVLLRLEELGCTVFRCSLIV